LNDCRPPVPFLEKRRWRTFGWLAWSAGAVSQLCGYLAVPIALACEPGSEEPGLLSRSPARLILRHRMLEATIRWSPIVRLLKVTSAQISRGAGAPLPESDWAIGLVRNRPEARPTWVRRLRCRVGLDRPFPIWSSWAWLSTRLC